MKKTLIAILFVEMMACSAIASYIGYLCPAGARQGDTCEIIAGGRELGKIKDLIIDGDPELDFITFESIRLVPNGLYFIQKPAQREFVNQWIRAVFQGTPAPALPEDTTGWNTRNRYLQHVDELTVLEREMLVRGFYTHPDPLQASPSIAQKAIITLKIAPDAPTGQHTIRFFSQNKRPAIFNPISFHISDKTEVREPFQLPPPAKPEIPQVTLPAVINGQILPGETDRFHLSLRKGEVWRFRVYGRALLPFIGDGVPGHFQPILQMLNQQGKEVAFQDDTYFDPDPILTFTVPATGQYTLAIRDAIYRGREDFVYRIEATSGTVPYQLFPAPGWTLPNRTMPDGQNCISAPFPSVIQGTILPGTPQKIEVQLEKGQDAVFEVWARRALSPLDSRLRLFAPDGKQLAMNDDFPRPKIGPVYHHADSYLRYTVPTTGTYTIEIADTANAGGPDYRYWLRIDKPKPDFRVWSVSSSLEIPADGGAAPMGLVVERLDGHSEDITLMQPDSEDFIIAGSQTLPYGPKRPNSFESTCGLQAPFPDCTKEYLTLAVRKTGKQRIISLDLLAKSGEITHPVIPADESMQAFAYYHLIEAKDWWGSIAWNNTARFSWTFNASSAVTLHPGQSIELKARTRDNIKDGSCIAELFSPPAGLSIANCQTADNEITLRLQADASMKPCRFNQIICLKYSREILNQNTKATQEKKISTTLPAVLLQLVESSLPERPLPAP